MTIPTTIPLVVKRPDRPFGLNYRPMVAEKDGPAAAYEAIPWFGDMVRDGSGESLEDQQELLKRTGLVTDLTMYLLYEAADTLVRIDNCKLPVQSIVVQVLPDFWLHGSRLQDLVKLYEDEGIDRSRLLLTIPEDVVFRANKTNTELITRYLRNGIPLVLDGYSLEKLPVARLEELGFTWLRLDPSLYLQQTTANTMYELRKTGFKLIGGGADTHDLLAWQLAAGVVYTGGTMTGVPAGEDDVIRDALLRERS
jgi:EAL domain-containing protein (putative c-di-GMP-specific phosphodiesterase class I)